MAHPYNQFRQSKTEHARAAKYADGGAVPDPDQKGTLPTNPLIQRQYEELNKPLPRPDDSKGGWAAKGGRINRASGGRANKSGKTNVNIIISGQGATSPAPAAGAGVPLSPPAPAPRPPMPMAGPPPGPMPTPPRSQGGRAYASGGAVKSGGAKRDSYTKVQHTPGKNDLKEMNRPKVVTYKTGGAVEAPKGKKGMGPKLTGGARGGEARLEKEHRAAKYYAKPKGSSG